MEDLFEEYGFTIITFIIAVTIIVAVGVEMSNGGIVSEIAQKYIGSIIK